VRYVRKSVYEVASVSEVESAFSELSGLKIVKRALADSILSLGRGFLASLTIAKAIEEYYA
jgi:hypothetical protein